MILIFGGIPWQVYFQRVLSAKSEKSAMYLSYVAAIGCLLSGIPPAIIGMIGKAAGKTNQKKISFKGWKVSTIANIGSNLTFNSLFLFKKNEVERYPSSKNLWVK